MAVEGKKKCLQLFDRRHIDKFAHRMYLEGREISLNQRASNSLNYYHETDYNNDVNFIHDDFDSHTHENSKRGYLSSQVAFERPNFVAQNMTDWEALTWG